MTPDPYKGNSGGRGDPTNPQSWNRYVYVLGDPINLTAVMKMATVRRITKPPLLRSVKVLEGADGGLP